jgi:2-polyprenyl-3-methyl-5-hydroxy-6-metoxy-1,4-benzoquinol methylase
MFTEMFLRTGAIVHAVDISPELIELANQRALPKDRVTFVVQRFEDCTIDGPFDAVIGSSVLHHLDVVLALKLTLALLKPGGWLSFAEPNLLNPQVYLERRFRSLPCFSYVSPDETAFVRWKLAALLHAIGFVDVSITPFDWLHPATPAPLIGFVSAMGRVLEWLPGVRELSGSMIIRARRRNDRPLL